MNLEYLKLQLEYWAPPLALITGIAGGFYTHFQLNPLEVTGLLALLLGVALWLLRRMPGLSLVLLVAACLIAGHAISEHALAESDRRMPSPEDLDKAYRIRARVLYQWETPYGWALKVDRIRVLSPESVSWQLRRLTVYIPELAQKPHRHRVIDAWIRLKRRWDPRPFPWPMQQLRQRFLPRIDASVKSPALISFQHQVSQPSESPLNRGNRELVDLFFKATPSFLWRERLAPFGLGHLLAISGLHCIFIYFGIQLMLWPLRRPIPRFLITLAGLLAFAHWVGWSASVTRASLMLILWHLLPHWSRPRSWIRLWCALMLAALVTNPLLLLTRGFWYSFAASLGLILGRRHGKASPLDHPGLARIRTVLPIVSAQFFVIPINLMFDNHTLFTSLFWNLLGFLMLMVLFVLLALCLLCLALPFLAPLANGLERVIASLLDLLAFRPGALELVRFPHHPAFILAILSLLALVLMYGKRELRWYLALAILAGFSLLHRPLQGQRLTMLDVGQGSCILYTGEDGEGYLFDAGGRLPAGLSLEHLTRLFGANRIEAAYISHLNLDHYNLLATLSPDFPVYVPPGQLAAFRNTPLLAPFSTHGLEKGQALVLDGLDGLVVWPPPGLSFPNTNEESLGILLQNDDWSLFLTGDAGRWMEQRLPDLEIREVMILQVGHHGSKSATGPGFVDRLEPDFALISCGRQNRFRHPHPSVLENLRREGVTTLVTAERGSIQIMVNGELLLGRYGAQSGTDR